MEEVTFEPGFLGGRCGRKHLSPLPHLPLISPSPPIAIWLLSQYGTALTKVISDLLVANPMDVS